jgi:hypothetical protein
MSNHSLKRIGQDAQNAHVPAKEFITIKELSDRQTKRPTKGQPGQLGQMQQAPQVTSLCDAQGKLRDAVNPYNQETTNWCWASSAQTVLGFHKEIRDQCSFVNDALSRSDCCGPRVFDSFLNGWFITTPSECDQGGWPHWVFEKLGYNYDRVRAPGTSNPADWTSYVEALNTSYIEILKRELCQNGPFISVLQIEGGVSGHTEVVRGIYEDAKFIEVNDHRNADFNTLSFDEFVGDDLDNPNGEYGYAQEFFYVEISRP